MSPPIKSSPIHFKGRFWSAHATDAVWHKCAAKRYDCSTWTVMTEFLLQESTRDRVALWAALTAVRSTLSTV